MGQIETGTGPSNALGWTVHEVRRDFDIAKTQFVYFTDTINPPDVIEAMRCALLQAKSRLTGRVSQSVTHIEAAYADGGVQITITALALDDRGMPFVVIPPDHHQKSMELLERAARPWWRRLMDRRNIHA